MPDNFEYVFAAYGLWMAAFALYGLHLFRKARRIRRGLEALPGSKWKG